MRLASQRERHHGTAVEGIFECDDGRTSRVSASNLDRVLDSLGAAVHKKCFLGKLARREFIQPLSKTDVTLVRSDLDTGMQKTIELTANRIDDHITPVPHVKAADATG